MEHVKCKVYAESELKKGQAYPYPRNCNFTQTKKNTIKCKFVHENSYWGYTTSIKYSSSISNWFAHSLVGHFQYGNPM